MLDQTETRPSRVSMIDEGENRVRESAVRLFERLNPSERDGDDAAEAEALAIYDWEIANDTEQALTVVRAALRLLDGVAVTVHTVNNEFSVIALAA